MRWKPARDALEQKLETLMGGTRETAVLVVRDALAPHAISTPNGPVDLLLLVGVQDVSLQRLLAERESARDAPGGESRVLGELRNENPNLVTPIRH